MKTQVTSLFVALWLACAANATACRGPFPPEMTESEAFEKAEAVFLGKVIHIDEGMPANFKPDDNKLYQQPAENVKRLGMNQVGRTIIFEPIRVWKGTDRGSNITLVEPYAQNTCEWNYDVQVGDEFIVFASRYGNYLTLPAQMFDRRSNFTLHNPSKRKMTEAQKENDAGKIKEAQEWFDEILRLLPQHE